MLAFLLLNFYFVINSITAIKVPISRASSVNNLIVFVNSFIFLCNFFISSPPSFLYFNYIIL